MKVFRFVTIFTAIAMCVSFSARAVAQTTCSVKVPVPNLEFCDATGTLEEHVDASVHETNGRIKSMQDYGGEIFELFNQQFNSILDDSKYTDTDIKDVEEEIVVLKQFVTNMQDTLMAAPETQIARGKRAAPTTSTTPSLQTLNAAKASFQQSVANLMQKLKNISNSVASEITKSAGVHMQFQKEITSNFQSLNALEQQIKTLAGKVQSALKNSTSGTTSGGVNLSSVTQDVTNLIINASVAEQVIQRQLDDLMKINTKLQITEHATGTKLASYTKEVNALNQNITYDEQQIAILKGSERIFEDQIGAVLANGTRDLAGIRADLSNIQSDIKSQSKSVLQTTIALGTYEQDLKSLRQSVDSVQSLVTFSKKAQQIEVGDILYLKKSLTDSINALKYAFGLTSTPP